MPRPFAVIGFTVFFIIALLYNSEIGAIVFALTVFAVALVVSLFFPEVRKQKVLPCALASGILACILLLSELNYYYLPAISYDQKTCEATLQLTDYPVYRYGKYYFDARAVELDGENTDLKMRMVTSNLPDAEPYDIVKGEFKLYALGSSSEENLASNKANGVFLGAYPVNGVCSVINIPENEKPFMKKIVDVRRAIKKSVHRAVPGDSGALATALLIGDRNEISAETDNNFRLSGITHIICVSGFHLSLCSSFILLILKTLRLNDKIASLITAIAVILFMFIAGMTYSVMRSGIMVLLYLIANMLFKKRDSLNSLGFSLVVISIYNPFAMGSAGLQLSVLSTLGIILYSQYIKSNISKHICRQKNEYLGELILSIIDPILISASATAFTLPVSVNIYNEFNFAVYISNILAVPIASVCILLSAGAAFWVAIFGDKFNFLGLSANTFCKLLNKISDVFADFDLLTFRVDGDSWSILLCGILLLCSMAVFMAFFGKNLYKTACALCAVMFTFGIMFSGVSRESETRINIIDVGNGTAVLASKNGENILIGCGGTEFLGAFRVIDETNNYGGKLNYLVVPSADEYSSAYLNEVLQSIRPENIICDELPYGSELLLEKSNVCSVDGYFATEEFGFRLSECDNSMCMFLESSDMSVLICFDSVFDYCDLPGEFQNADIIITRNDYPMNIESKNCKLLILNSENSRGIAIQKELSESGIKCVATGGCGNILLRGENGAVSANRY